MINQHIDIPLEEIIAFAERYPIRKLSLFGSVLRDDFGPDSDVDILVEFEPEVSITYLDLAQMEIELSHLMGRKVDLREPEELSRYFRNRVIEAAITLYERE